MAPVPFALKCHRLHSPRAVPSTITAPPPAIIWSAAPTYGLVSVLCRLPYTEPSDHEALAAVSAIGPRRSACRISAGLAPTSSAVPAEILHADLRGPIALTAASASWSLGSVYGKRHKTETSPYVGAALQMIAGGGAVIVLGTALGEWSRWHLSAKGTGAMAYLVVFGSILGYSAYTYALRHASPTIVGTYAYVNPVIAVLLGWLILAEPVTARTFLAMALILGAVVWIQFSHKIGRSAGHTNGRPETTAAVQQESS